MKYNLSELNRVPRSLALAVAIALVLIASGVVHQAAAQQYSAGPKLSKFVQQGSNAAANTMFSGGRDLIDDAQWVKAEEKFAEYMSAYPKEKNLDAAMYWMAYSQYKLNKFDQCKDTITRLLKTYENTTWKEDAQLLQAQLPNGVTVKVDPITVTVDAVTASVDLVDLQMRTQDVQERVAEAKARAQERAQEALQRAQEAQERAQERVKEAQDRLKDKPLFKIRTST